MWEESVESNFSKNIFSENFVSNYFEVFSEPMGTINIRIMRQDSKRKQNYEEN